jgi:hypothetical protein
MLYKWVISICLVSAVTSGGLEARTQVYGTVNGSGVDACLELPWAKIIIELQNSGTKYGLWFTYFQRSSERIRIQSN